MLVPIPAVPHPDWLNALKLPTKILVGLFLFFVLLLFLDRPSLIPLDSFWVLARPAVMAGALLFGCLSFTSLVSLAYKLKQEQRKPALLEARRKIRQDEADACRVKYEAAVLGRLDYLSKDEIRYVADGLRAEEKRSRR